MSFTGYKQRLFKWIGHDPVITDAASTSRPCNLSLSGRRRDDLTFLVAIVAGSLKTVAHNGPSAARAYVSSLFPFTNWILNYNLTWLTGDLIAGITVGLVVVPQSLSYAKIATLSSEYGLYSSFVGMLRVMIYAIFATSKDVTIGPVAVMSLQVSKVIANVQAKEGGHDIPGHVIATALALICGIIVFGIGLFRLGFIVEFISAPAVAGFMTGSAINIAAGQVPSLMGYSNLFNTRAATYQVIINSLKHLPNTKLDAAFGLTGLFFLYFVRYVAGRTEREARNPIIRRIAFFVNTLRIAFVIIILTVVSWAHLRHLKPADYDISIIKTVPSGFRHMGKPEFNTNLLSLLGSEIPVSVIILLLEHIAISKSFGRVNNYKIVPDQELLAMGVTNIFGSFFAAYPATGSFSRSAIKSRAGVRTPLAGWFTGICVIVALYGLTSGIPNAALAAVIIEAVGGLIASPPQAYAFWLVSPLECIIFLAAVIITVFSTIEIGVYFSVAASAALLLLRMAKPRGSFLGRVRVRHDEQSAAPSIRDVYVPIQPDGVRNPNINVEAPPAGIVVFKMEAAFLYINASRYADQIYDYVKEHFRNGQNYNLSKPGERPWNGALAFAPSSLPRHRDPIAEPFCRHITDPGPNWFQRRKAHASVEAAKVEANAAKPLLKAVVFDFSGVSNVDTTSIQNLVDLRRVLSRYAGQEVEFHFATILSPWIKRALLAGGFGRDVSIAGRPLEVAAVVPPERADEVGSIQPAPLLERQSSTLSAGDIKESDLESGGNSRPVLEKSWERMETVEGIIVSTDFAAFHIDLPSAVATAAAN
ncbi:SPOSA6832_04407, partial [Sporobolomyces salmonicolor]